jgi:hypothetical protein
MDKSPSRVDEQRRKAYDLIQQKITTTTLPTQTEEEVEVYDLNHFSSGVDVFQTEVISPSKTIKHSEYEAKSTINGSTQERTTMPGDDDVFKP